MHAKATALKRRLRLALLLLFARLSAPFFPHRGGVALSRILVIRPDHLGDLLFATPALRALREALPQAHITAMVGPWGREVLQGNPCLDELITCPFPGFTRRPKASLWEPYVLLKRWSERLRTLHFDVALILRFDHWWGALLAYLARIPCRTGYAVPEVAPFLTMAVTYVPGRHEVEQNLALVEAITGREARRGPLEFPLTAADRRWAEEYLARQGVPKGKPLVCLHPGAGAPVKLWRPEAWARLADELVRRFHACILITGSMQELDLAWDVASRMEERAIVAAGRTSLAQLAALMARSQLVIGPDSGPLHLAVAVGTPTVHLYGPVDWHTFGPWGDPHRHLVLTSRMSCIPCNRLDYSPSELPRHPCVRNIRVDQVLEAAEKLLR